jgi:hypothetical protein
MSSNLLTLFTQFYLYYAIYIHKFDAEQVNDAPEKYVTLEHTRYNKYNYLKMELIR